DSRIRQREAIEKRASDALGAGATQVGAIGLEDGCRLLLQAARHLHERVVLRLRRRQGQCAGAGPGGPRFGFYEASWVHARGLHPTGSQDDEVVAMNHLVEAPIAQALLDLARLGSSDLPAFRRVEVHQSPRELLAVGRHDGHDLTGRKFAVDLYYP